MNKQEQVINQFLLDMLNVFKENNDVLNLSNETYAIRFVYRALVGMGVDNNKGKSSDFFSSWIKRYSDQNNIDCFVSQDWKYFCQFKNEASFAIENQNAIKVYVPQDYEHIYQSANMIFDFLSSNNIPHCSKISSEIRFDDIVIRLLNDKDAEKLRNYIKNNSYIQEGLIPPNPFALQYDNLAYACDGMLSYNRRVCDHIVDYIFDKLYINNNEYVSMIDFYNHVKCQCDKHDFLYDRDCCMIDKIMLSALSNKMSIEEYYQFYINNTEFIVQPYNTDYSADLSAGEMLRKIYETMQKKYGMDEAVNRINASLVTNNYNYITRENGARRMIKSTQFQNEIQNILDNETFYRKFYESEDEKEQYLKDAIIETYNKYNFDQVMYAINKLICESDYFGFASNYNGFASNNDARTKLLQNISARNAIDFIYQYNIKNNPDCNLVNNDAIIDNITEDMVIKYLNNIISEKELLIKPDVYLH